MNKSRLYKTSLRFKQWSRKAYAAFRSVGRHVTIGSLKNVVADALLGKQKNGCNTFVILWPKDNNFCDDEWSNPPPEELQETLIPCLRIEKSNYHVVEYTTVLNCYTWLKALLIKAFSFFYYNI